MQCVAIPGDDLIDLGATYCSLGIRGQGVVPGNLPSLCHSTGRGTGGRAPWHAPKQRRFSDHALALAVRCLFVRCGMALHETVLG